MKTFSFLLFLTLALPGCAQKPDKGLLSNLERATMSADTPRVLFIGRAELYSTDESGAVTNIWKEGKYSVEKSLVGFWEVDTFAPVTPALIAHLKKADGVESVFNKKRYKITVYIGKMHEHRAIEIITGAMDSFKE